MIVVEDDLAGGEDNKSGESVTPRSKKRRMSDRDEVESLRDMIITTESQRFMTFVVDDMKVGDPVRVSCAGLRKGGESEELLFRSCLYGVKILQGKNVLYHSLLF